MALKRSSQKDKIDKGRKKNEFQSLFWNQPAPVWIHDRETLAFLEMNRVAVSMLGYEKADLKTITLEKIISADKIPHLHTDPKLGRRNGHFRGEWHLRTKGGKLISVELTSSLIDYDGRKAVLVIVHAGGEQTMESRIFGSRRRISEFAHSHSLDEVLQKTLDEAELLTNSSVGFFHFVEKDQKTLSLQNWSTNTLKNMCTAVGKWSHYSIDEAGVWADCVRQRGPVICNDYAGLAHRKGMPPGHSPVSRLLTVPVMRNDRVVAIFGIGNKPVDYDDVDLSAANLLADLAWDIAGGMRVENELNIAEENYRTIFENATVGIFQSTPDGRFRKINPEMARIFGYDSPEDMITSITDISCQVYANASSRERFVNFLSRDGGTFDFIEMNLRKDGSAIWTSTSARVVKDEKGNILYYEGFLMDITVRKQAEEALRENAMRYRIVADNTSDWEFWQGPDGKFIYLSPSCKNITGHDVEEFTSDPSLLEKIIHPDDLGAFKMHQYSTLLEKAAGEIEFRIVLPDGGVRWIGHVCQPVFDDHEHYLGIRGSNRNITARKQAEEAFQRAKESLEDVNHVLLGAIEREQRISRTDGLTEIFNRRYFFELAAHELSVAKRYQHPLSLIMFDIDHFKKFNDLYGHQMGDEVLRRITQIAREQLRSADILARYGGEEFTVLLPNSSGRESFVVAERIRETVGAYKLLTEGGLVGITISTGVAEYLPDIQNLDQLIGNADKAMYAAKQAGRNCTVTYKPEM